MIRENSSIQVLLQVFIFYLAWSLVLPFDPLTKHPCQTIDIRVQQKLAHC